MPVSNGSALTLLDNNVSPNFYAVNTRLPAGGQCTSSTEAPMIPGSPLVPLPEAARALGWAWHTAWRAVVSGRLPAERRGGRWFIPRAALEGELERPRLTGAPANG